MWGMRPRLSLWLWKQIVRPSVLFGALVWARVVHMSKTREALTKLQYLALNSMGCFRKGTPAAGLEVITHTPPLLLAVKHEAALAYLRTMDCPKVPRQR